jgi:hypothetical protein
VNSAETDPSLAAAEMRFAAAARAWIAGTARHAMTPELIEMLSLLAQQAEWRVFADGTKNLGHQASTVMLLRRLIELTAFRGCVVVVYADHGRPLLGRTAEKLALMFAGVDPRRLNDEVAGYGSCRDIRFLPLQRAGELRDAIAFGFTGGADDLALNGAVVLNVRFFLRLQPYLWDDPPSACIDAYYECSRIEQPDGRHLYPLRAWPELQKLAIQPPPSLRHRTDMASWHWYTQQQGFDAGLASRMRNALAVLEARSEGRRLLWPVYGLQHFKDAAAEIILSCSLLALRCARERRSTVLLCWFSSPQDVPDWADLADALAQDLSTRERALPTLAAALARRHAGDIEAGRLQPHDLARRACALGQWLHARCSGVALAIHRASEGTWWRDLGPSLSPALTRHGQEAVHVIELGPVAMDAFHHFVADADLPSVIEGQAASNLLTTLGRPFLQLLRPEHVIKNAYAAATSDINLGWAAERMATGARELRDLALAGMPTVSPSPDPAAYGERLDHLAPLVIDAGDATSEIARYFQALAEHFRSPSNDKLFVILLALREVVLAG